MNLLVEAVPEIYGAYVILENGTKILYVEVLKVLYRMLKVALLWYKKFKLDLEEIGFIFNACDPCMANRFVNRKQHTVRFHVDDLMSSHEDSKVHSDFYN